jgi:hypothetical protein
MYRLIFLLLFSLPISGMNLELHKQPFCTAKHVVHCHDINNTTDVIQVKKLWLRRMLLHNNNTVSFNGAYYDNGQVINLSESEAELDFHSFMRKICEKNKNPEKLLNKLNP